MTPSVVLVHGLGQGPQSWQEVITGLARSELWAHGFRDNDVLAPWVTGLRPGDERHFDLDDAAADLGRAIELGCAGGRAVVVGLSLGACVATKLAADRPELVSGLVLCGGQVRPPRRVLRAERLALRLVPERRFRDQGVSKRRVLDVLDLMLDLDLRDALRRIEAPTLVVIGAKDRANGPAAQELSEGIAHSHLHTVPGAGHQLNTEQPQHLSDLIAAFVSQLQ